LKRIAIIVGIAVVFILVVGLALPFLVDANPFRPELQRRLIQALGRSVTLGDLNLAVFSGSVRAKDLSIGEGSAFGKDSFVRANALKVSVDLWPLILSRQVNVTGVTIQKPDINLVQNAAGVWNFSSLGGHSPSAKGDQAPASSALTSFSIASVEISDGRVTLQRLGGKAEPWVMEPVAFEMKDFSETSSFPFSLTMVFPSGGDLKLNGRAGPVNPGDVIATPFDAQLAVSRLNLAASGIFDPSTGVSGLVSVDGSAKSQAANVVVQGNLKAEQLKLAKGGSPAKRVVEIRFDVAHDLEKLLGTIQRADIHVGSALLATAGTYSVQTQPSTAALKISGSNMPVTDLATTLPALNISLPSGASIEGGTAQLNVACNGPLDRQVTTGTIALENTKLANYDLGTKLKVIEALAGIKSEPQTTIQTFSTSLKNSPSGTQLDDIRLVVPSIGEMTGSGTISPAHELSFRMRATVQSTISAVSSVSSKNGIPFTIAGTSQNPSFAPDVKSLATDKLKDVAGSAGVPSGIVNSLFGGKKKH
jgi:AsmA protein